MSDPHDDDELSPHWARTNARAIRGMHLLAADQPEELRLMLATLTQEELYDLTAVALSYALGAVAENYDDAADLLAALAEREGHHG